MRMRYVISLIIVFFAFCCNAQDASKKAKEAFQRGEYKVAAQLYELSASTAENVEQRNKLYADAKRAKQCESLRQSGINKFEADDFEGAANDFQKLKSLNPADVISGDYLKKIVDIKVGDAQVGEREINESQTALSKGDYNAAKKNLEEASRAVNLYSVGNNETRKKEISDAMSEVNKIEAMMSEAETEYAKLIQNPSLSGCERVKMAYSEVLRVNPGNTKANVRIKECDNIKAEVLVWNKTVESNSFEMYMQYNEKYPDGLFAERSRMAISRLDSEAWGKAKKINTPEAYRSYLSSFPDGIGEHERNLSKDFSLWDAASGAEDISKYETYLNRFPRGIYAKSAKDKVNELKDKRDWLEAQNAGTKAAYDAYISKHPNGKYRQNASSAVTNMNEATAWDSALATNTKKAYQTYIDNHINGKHISEARSRISEIDAADNKLWQELKSARTEAKLKEYMSYYPNGIHIKETASWDNLFKAQRELSNSNWSKALYLYSNAISILSENDKADMAYARFMANPSIIAGQEYINKYPNNVYNVYAVKDKVARLFADSMTEQEWKSSYKMAMNYAQDEGTKSYIKGKKRKVAGTPVHLAVDGNYNVPAGSYGLGAYLTFGREENPFKLMTGLGYEKHNDCIVNKDDLFKPSSSYAFNGVQISRLSVPVTLNLKFGVFYIGGGVAFNYQLGNMVDFSVEDGETIYSIDRENATFVNPYNIDAVARVGIGWFGVSVNYQLTDVYDFNYLESHHPVIYDTYSEILRAPTIKAHITFTF